jgi:tRNA-specific 2-thiouridylase
MKKERVLLGMSGGVDSSVAGHLLTRQGYEVVGVTMKVWPQDCMSRAEDKCCGPSAIADARAVAHKLGIPHYVVDEADRFEQVVIGYFADEYRAGRTPNPCVMCNELLKFGSLWDKARALGCAFLATGHYAMIQHENGISRLRKGRDPRKDQSYFLFSLRPEQLGRALTPLGAMTKPEIRAIARSLGLRVADKVDSQEICFVPGNDYRTFLRDVVPEFRTGGIYDTSGKYLGEHEGIELYTIGQRKGLPGGSPAPMYVVDLDPETARVIVGAEHELLRDEFEVERVNWLGGNGGRPFRADVKIRYAHAGIPALVEPMGDGRARIVPDEPLRAVTAGQAAVFYIGDEVAGGGWIVRGRAIQAAAA